MRLKRKKTKTEVVELRDPIVIDCRKIGYRNSSVSYTPHDGGLEMSIASHEGVKPHVGDYILLGDGESGHVYQAYSVDWCFGVDPANMWMARANWVAKASVSNEVMAMIKKALANV